MLKCHPGCLEYVGLAPEHLHLQLVKASVRIPKHSRQIPYRNVWVLKQDASQHSGRPVQRGCRPTAQEMFWCEGSKKRGQLTWKNTNLEHVYLLPLSIAVALPLGPTDGKIKADHCHVYENKGKWVVELYSQVVTMRGKLIVEHITSTERGKERKVGQRNSFEE